MNTNTLIKNIACALALASLVAATSGCRNPGVGPALLRTAVGTAATVEVIRDPEILPGLKAGAAVVCASAAGTNLSPTAISAAIDAYGGQTAKSAVLLQFAVNTYNMVYLSLKSTNDAAVRPYVMAVCGGLTDAVGIAPLAVQPPATAARSRNAPPVQPYINPQWPQITRPK